MNVQWVREPKVTNEKISIEGQYEVTTTTYSGFILNPDGSGSLSADLIIEKSTKIEWEREA